MVKPRIQEEQCGFQPGCRMLEQLFTLTSIPEGSKESSQPAYMSFEDLEKAYDHVPWGVRWGVLQQYKVQSLLLQAIWSLYKRRKSLVCISSSKSDLYQWVLDSTTAAFCLFVTFMDGISKHSQDTEWFWLGDLRIARNALFFLGVIRL